MRTTYALTEKEIYIISALAMKAARKQEELLQVQYMDKDRLYTLGEFDEELLELRRPLMIKDFKSDFLDKVLMKRLDAFNPTNYLKVGANSISLKDYIFMVNLNAKVLNDLQNELMLDNKVS